MMDYLIQTWQMVLNFDAHLPDLVFMHANMVYLIVFGVIFLQIGVLPFFFLPSNPFLFVCGAVWAASHLSLSLLLIVLTAAAILGNLCGYGLGKTLGQIFFVNYLKWPNQTTLDKTRVFYHKHGEKGFLFCLFLPVVRTIAPFLAGITQMVFYKFVRAASAGSALWVLTCVLMGYFFGNIPIIMHHLGTFTLAGLAVVLLVVICKKSWEYFNKLN